MLSNGLDVNTKEKEYRMIVISNLHALQWEMYDREEENICVQ